MPVMTVIRASYYAAHPHGEVTHVGTGRAFVGAKTKCGLRVAKTWMVWGLKGAPPKAMPLYFCKNCARSI